VPTLNTPQPQAQANPLLVAMEKAAARTSVREIRFMAIGSFRTSRVGDAPKVRDHQLGARILPAPYGEITDGPSGSLAGIASRAASVHSEYATRAWIELALNPLRWMPD
jgi:hypothetical protein